MLKVQKQKCPNSPLYPMNYLISTLTTGKSYLPDNQGGITDRSIGLIGLFQKAKPMPTGDKSLTHQFQFAVSYVLREECVIFSRKLTGVALLSTVATKLDS